MSTSSRPPILLCSALVFGLIAFVCAFFGFSGAVSTLPERVFAAAGVLMFQLPRDAPTNTLLSFALIAAALYGLTLVLGVVFEVSPRLREWKQRVFSRFKPDPAVVIGLGHVGMQLTRDLREEGRPVYALEVNANNPRVDEARAEDALVVVGDITSVATRERLPLDRAAEVFVVTGDDVRNLEVAGVLLNAATTGQASASGRGEDAEAEARPHRVAYVHAGSAAVLNAAEQQGLLSPRRGGTAFRLFSVLVEAATDLMEHLHLHHAPDEDEVAHYVLFGFGEVGQAVALGMARLAHFPNGRRLRLTVIHGPEEREARDRFLALHPAFCPQPGSYTLDGFTDTHGPDADRWDWFDAEVRPDPDTDARTRSGEHPGAVEYAVNAEFIERAAPVSGPTVADMLARFRASPPAVCPAVVVAFDDEQRNARVAVGLRDRLSAALAWPPDPPKNEKPPFSTPPAPDDGLPSPLPIYVYQFAEDGLHSLLDPPSAPATSRTEWFRAQLNARYPIRPFGLQKKTASYAAVTQPDRRYEARHLREAYEALSGHRRIEVPPAFVRSNLDSALLNSLTLQREFEEVPEDATGAIRLTPQPSGDGAAFQEMIREFVAAVGKDLAGALAAMEHNRWMAERLTSGWRQGQRSEAGRYRDSFLAWSDEALKEDDRRYDRAQIPGLLVAKQQKGQYYRLRASRWPSPAPPGYPATDRDETVQREGEEALAASRTGPG